MYLIIYITTTRRLQRGSEHGYLAFEFDLVKKAQAQLSRTPVPWVEQDWGGAPLGRAPVLLSNEARLGLPGGVEVVGCRGV